MKYVLAWIKNNPISVVAIFLVIASLGMLVWMHTQGSSFVEQMADRSDEIKKIDGLKRTRVELPPAVPDAPPQTKILAVNTAAIDYLKDTYGKLDQEYRGIFEVAVLHNEYAHFPMVDQLFPNSESPALPYNARSAYRLAFEEMLGPYAENSLYPRLQAAPALDSDELGLLRSRLQNELLREMLPLAEEVDLDMLSEQDFRRLKQNMRKRYLQELIDQAENIFVYAQTQSSKNDYPFDLGRWSKRGERPSWSEMWEGQMDLWMQQDVARAIMLTNRVGQRNESVISAPVKRLLKIQVVPGYVGINSAGGIAMLGQQNRGSSSNNEGRMPAPFPDQAANVGSADAKLLEDFSGAPTGRRSNALYDVRHLWLTIHIDSRRTALFFENLAKVNFMSVLHVDMKDLDEYELLREGYVYGADDVVEMKLLVESLWLRDWTAKYMPDEIKQNLGFVMNQK